MNIFALEGIKNDIDFIASAKSIDNLRVSKMCIETTQILSSALFLNNCWNNTLYKPTHLRHPSVLWASESSSNFYNLYEHGKSLFEEYFERYKKSNHGSYSMFCNCYQTFSPNINKFLTDKETPFRMAMPLKFQDKDDVVGSYRRYFASKDNILYPKDKIPSWFDELRKNTPYRIK